MNWMFDYEKIKKDIDMEVFYDVSGFDEKYFDNLKNKNKNPSLKILLFLEATFLDINIIDYFIFEDVETIGDRIKQCRLIACLTQEELSEEADVDATCVFRWEKNQSSPTKRSIKKISEFFNIEVSYFLEGGDLNEFIKKGI